MGGVQNGIEKASKILMPVLFVILVAVVIYCLCLGSGVKEGLNFYLNPDFGALGFNGVLALGWFTFKGESKKDRFRIKYLNDRLEEEGLKLGKFGMIFAFMVKYVTPILIAVIEVVGVLEIVFPVESGKSNFSLNGLIIVLTAYVIVFIAVVVYFALLKNKPTGSNEDELIEKKKPSGAEK